MENTNKNIFEIWRSRAHLLNARTPKWIWQTSFVILILFVMPIMEARFNKQIVFSSVMSGSLYLVAAIIILIQVSHINAQHFRARYAYPFSILLYTLYDVFSISMMFSIFWSFGIDILVHQNIVSLATIRFFFYWLAVFVIISSLFSRYNLVQKIKFGSQQPKPFKHFRTILACSSGLPGLGIIITVFLFHAGRLEIEATVVASMALIGALLLLFFIIIALDEIIYITIHKWPKIRKSGSEFVVTDPLREC